MACAQKEPNLLLLELHGELLRLLSDRAGMHFAGLQVASRHFRRAGSMESKTAKKLAQLDVVSAWLRHVTVPLARDLAVEVAGQVQEKSGDTSRACSNDVAKVDAEVQEQEAVDEKDEHADSMVCSVYEVSQAEVQEQEADAEMEEHAGGMVCSVEAFSVEGDFAVETGELTCSELGDAEQAPKTAEENEAGSEGKEKEEIIGVPVKEKKRDKFYWARVKHYFDGGWDPGRVQDIEMGATTKEKLYKVLYDDGDLQHLTLPEVKKAAEVMEAERRNRILGDKIKPGRMCVSTGG